MFCCNVAPTWPGAVACLMTCCCCCCWPPGGRCWTTCWPPTWTQSRSNLSLLRENSLLVETPTRAPAPKQPLPQPQHQSNLHQRSTREKRDPPAEKSQATPGLLPPAATARWKSSRSDPVGPAAVEPAGPPAALPLAPAGGHLQGFALAGGNIQISSA